MSVHCTLYSAQVLLKVQSRKSHNKGLKVEFRHSTLGTAKCVEQGEAELDLYIQSNKKYKMPRN